LNAGPFLALALLSQDAAQFRISTDVVQVDVFVGESGRAIRGLDAADFELYDDGNLQAIDAVSIESLPLSVVLALDTSASVKGPHLAYLRNAARQFVDGFSPADRAALLTFSHHLSLRSPLTSEVSSLQSALSRVEPGGATSWHDALFAALEILEPVRERTLVLLFTDGADTYSWLSEERMLPLVRRSNAVLYAVARSEETAMPDVRTTLGQARWREQQWQHAERTRLLRELAEESGGRLLETRSSERLEALFLEILAEVKTRYVLLFRPEPPIREGWHELEVRVKRKGATVEARRGYYYEDHH
jgi:VWFA-related protein